MATIEEDRLLDGNVSNADVDASPRDVVESQSLKRKVSPDDDHDGSPKRARHDDDDRDAADRRSRRESPPSRRASYGNVPNLDQDRRKSATQEERKRGKRLFGGLLSTLSQTSGSSQQKRRLEIERRQQERLQKQKVEDDKERTEKLARVTEIRMTEQIGWEEEVMRNKHSKMLAMAQFLRTKSQPQIFYLPWKLSQDQEDEIDEQTRDAKASIARDLEAFNARKKRHEKEYGRSAQAARSATPEKAPVQAVPDDTSLGKPARSINGSEPSLKSPEKDRHNHHHHHHNHHHHHDEAADVLEEADEDMVIY